MNKTKGGLGNPVEFYVKKDCWLQYYKSADWAQRLTIESGDEKHVVICSSKPKRINGIKAGKWRVLHEYAKPKSVKLGKGFKIEIEWGPWIKGTKGAWGENEWAAQAYFDDGTGKGDEDYNDAVARFIYKEKDLSKF